MRKDEQKTDKSVDNLPPLGATETKDSNAITPDEHKDEEFEQGGLIEPVAFQITLNHLHPHSSYWRCGHQFFKSHAVEIAASDLMGDEVIILSEDPYLTFVPVVEQ